MAIHSLVTVGRTGSVGKYLECGSHIFHFGGYGVSSISIAILFVNLQGVIHGGRNFNPKLMSLLEVSGDALLQELYDMVAFLQHMWHSPVEGWLLVNLHKFCVFRSFNRV